MVIGKELHLIGFRIGAETFGVPIEQVHEIVRVPEITSVPAVPDCVEGGINLRGKIIPVVDLSKRFGEETITRSRKNRIVVAEVEAKLIGLMVDAASEVLKISPEDVEPPPNVFSEQDVNYVTGVGKQGGRLVILIDLRKVLQQGELKSISQIQAAITAG
jgi:purine-binding chemotaxis protein CheW